MHPANFGKSPYFSSKNMKFNMVFSEVLSIIYKTKKGGGHKLGLYANNTSLTPPQGGRYCD